MAAEKRYPVPPETADNALLGREAYERMYRRSLEDPDAFWGEQAETFLTWFEPWDRVRNNDLTQGQIRWFEGGKLNVSYNCLDRHLDTHGDRNAIIWEGDEPGVTRHITYRELHADVCRLGQCAQVARRLAG